MCKWKKESDEWCHQTESKELFHLCIEKKQTSQVGKVIIFKNIHIIWNCMSGCNIYLEEKMLYDSTLLFSLKTWICLAELMHATTERKMVAFALVLVCLTSFENTFLHANVSNLNYLNCLYSSINID